MRVRMITLGVLSALAAAAAQADESCDLRVTRERNVQYGVCYNELGPPAASYDLTKVERMDELEICLLTVKDKYARARRACGRNG